MSEHSISLKDLKQIRLSVAIISLLFSALAFYTDSLINSDGVLYLRMAMSYLEGGLSATAQLYDWPFFSILIALLHQFTGIGLERCGEIINSLLFVVFTDALILICSQLVSNRLQLIITAVLILSFITLNDYRSYIIRDIGYWAFISVAIYRLMKFLPTPSFNNALLWLLSGLLATLFRVEAIVIIAASPLFLFLQSHPDKQIKAVFKLYSGLIAIGVIAGLFLIQQQGLAAAFGKLQQFASFTDTSSLFAQRSDSFATTILNQHSEEYSAMILIGGLLTMFIYKLFNGVGLVLLGLYGYSRYHFPLARKCDYIRRYLLYFAAINLIILLAFLYKEFFISTRYMLMLIMSLFLLLIPQLSAGIEQLWRNKHKKTLVLLIVIALVSIVDTFHHTVSKGYIKETAIWASQNLPASSYTITDNKTVDFYFDLNAVSTNNIALIADAVDFKHHLSPQQIKRYDFIILVRDKKDRNKYSTIHYDLLESVYSAENSRGDSAIVYRVLK